MPRPELRFEGIGTHWRIDAALPLEAPLERAILAEVERFDRSWSRFRDDSLIHRISQQAGEWAMPPETDALLRLYLSLEESTAGAVTPLVGRRLEDLGYGPGYRLTPAAGALDRADAPAGPRLAEVIDWDGERLRTHEPVLLDIGAAGKGLLIDLLTGILREAGHEDFCVDASGDLRASGPALRVALEDPRDDSKAVGVLELQDGALCASGIGRRRWGEELHHVLDGRTGRPAAKVTATWALAGTAMVADALATALFFVSPALVETLLPGTGPVAGVRIFASGAAEYSLGLPGEVFTA